MPLSRDVANGSHTLDAVPGTLRPGRHIRYADETPITNLYVSMLDRMGVPVEQIGDSTGRLEGLSEL